MIFRVGIALLKMHESRLLSEEEEASAVFRIIREIGPTTTDADELLEASHPKQLPFF